MAKKSSSSQTIVIAAIIAIVALIVAFYFFSTQKSTTNTAESDAPVLSSTTTTGPAGQISSAAYAKCADNGGFVTTSVRGTYGCYNVCNFADDRGCELYALYLGQCPVGGVSTIGYTTTDQVFCALRGGTPQGSENGQCKMPDGIICSTASVFSGTCAPI